MSWKRRAVEAAAGLVLIALPALAQKPTGREERIVSFIHQANLHEIEASKLAQERSSSQQVKDFANQMIADHEGADQQLRSYAQQHQIDLDALRQHLMEVNDRRLADERQSRAVGTATGEWAFTWENANVAKSEDDNTLARLRQLSGAAFDRAYVSDMVQGHQKAVDRLTNVLAGYRREPDVWKNREIDPGVRTLIESLLPTVKHHLEMAQGLQGVVSKA